MRKFLSAFAIAATAAGGAAASDGKDALVTILTAPEPQTQLMAMVLSMEALQQGARVDILLCGPAGDIALKDAPASATAPQKPKGMSPQGLMTKIIGAGGTVEVCALYLPNRGVGPEVLLDGVAPAMPPAMTAKILADDTRIISF